MSLAAFAQKSGPLFASWLIKAFKWSTISVNQGGTGEIRVLLHEVHPAKTLVQEGLHGRLHGILLNVDGLDLVVPDVHLLQIQESLQG